MSCPLDQNLVTLCVSLNMYCNAAAKTIVEETFKMEINFWLSSVRYIFLILYYRLDCLLIGRARWTDAFLVFGLSTVKNIRGSSIYPVCMVVFFVGEHWWWFLFSRYIDAVVNFNFVCPRSRQQSCEFFCFFNSLRSFHVNNMEWDDSLVGRIRSELPAFALYCEFLQGGVQSPSLHLIILKIL